MQSSQPLIAICDIAWGRLQSPDLDVMESFLTEFGMVKSARTATTLYMRGTGPSHHLHVTEKGDPGSMSVAFLAGSEEDLKRIAAIPGATGVEHIDEPGGGKRLRIKEPVNGFLITKSLRALRRLPGDRLIRNRGQRTAECGGRFEAAKASGFDVGRPDAGGLAQRVEPGSVLCFAILDQAQSFAQHFACVLVASGGHELFDEVCLVVGEDDITSRHGSLASICECWHNMP